MSKRTPMEHMVVLYGGPQMPTWPDPVQPWVPATPVPFIQPPSETTPDSGSGVNGTKIVINPDTVDWEAMKKLVDEARAAKAYDRVKSHVRVVTRKEADGTIKLKVYIDGELKTEVESDGTTLNAEFDL